MRVTMKAMKHRTMISKVTIVTLTTTTFALVLPQQGCNEPTTGGVDPLYPVSIAIKLYQSDSQSIPSGLEVCSLEQASSGTMKAGVCQALCSAGLAIDRAPASNCSFTLYRGSSTCGADVEEKVSVQIEAGEGSVCVETGVEDGCEVQKASGVWVCG